MPVAVIPGFRLLTWLGKVGSLHNKKRAGCLPPLRSAIAFVYWPVPVRAAVCGLPPPLSATLSVALRVPVAVGLNCMLTVQLAPPAIELPHVFPEIRKSPGLVPAMENPVNATV